MSITRRNHYVPEWYQKRFLSSKTSSLYYLNLTPSVIDLPNGTKKQLNGLRPAFSPSQCFWQKDLYTTQFFGFINDEIERYLFGKIDDEGMKAVAAMAEQEYVNLHKHFLKFFEYIDIQKIRTPKGLSWIQSKYPSITHNQLLQEMQQIRKLHCTIWAESVREIVYATEVKIKFLVSDHPVTVYNHACLPNSSECSYPNDPRIEMKATQTIFPLDRDRCLIFTNLDYARDPNLSDPKVNRPNSMPFRETLIRMDNTICKRKLSDDEVASVNLILKARARQFIAAENRDWLYPERTVKKSWRDLGKVLLPPSNELYHFGGEIYVGHEDGTSSYYDAYGRTRGEATYLKKRPVKDPGPNDMCICGSGKKYKKCCREKPEDERPSSTVRSIRERNIQLFEIIVAILGFDGKKDWVQIRKELTDQKISDIHKAVAALWPPDTDLMSLLPRPDLNVSRALYSGLLDPRVSYRKVSAFSFFADEILILNPFLNGNNIRKEYNPIDNPAQYRQDTLKNVIFFVSFFPLIQSGHVHVIPDPLNFYSGLRRDLMAEGEKRRQKVKLDEKSTAAMKKLFMEDHKRFMFNLPDDHLIRLIKKSNSGISDEDAKKTLEYIKKKNEEDPLAMLHPHNPDEASGQMLISHLSPNWELGMFLAQATGSFILTHHPYRWSEICSSVDYFYNEAVSAWERIAQHITNLPMDLIYFKDCADLIAALDEGDLKHMKLALKNVWNAVQVEQPKHPAQVDELIKDIGQAQKNMSNALDRFVKRKNEGCKEYLRVVRRKAKLSSRVAPSGHSTSAVYRFLLSHASHEKYLKSLPLSLYIEEEEDD